MDPDPDPLEGDGSKARVCTACRCPLNSTSQTQPQSPSLFRDPSEGSNDSGGAVHSRMSQSAAALAMRPSGSTARARTGLRWPINSASYCSVKTFHSLMEWSEEADTMNSTGPDDSFVLLLSRFPDPTEGDCTICLMKED